MGPLLLLWASHQTECVDEGWTFPGMKAGSHTTEALCTYRSHSFIFCGQQQRFCIINQRIRPSVFSNGADAAFSAFKKNFVKNLCNLSLAVFHNICLSPTFSSSFLYPSCPISAPLTGTFSVPPSFFPPIRSRFCYLYRKSLNWC